jgi:hypothetical protein
VTEHTVGTTADKLARADEIASLIYIREPKIHPHRFRILQNGTHADTKYLTLYNDGLALLRNIPLQQKNKLMINFRGAEDGSTLEIRADSLHGKTLIKINLTEDHKGHLLFEIPLTSGTRDLYFHVKHPNLKKDVRACTISWILFYEDIPGTKIPGYDNIQKTFVELLNSKTKKTPILVENRAGYRRKTHVFTRGNWLTPGAEVTSDVPASLPELAEHGSPPDRLAFARWLVSAENPLTARVTVNRFWEQLFGTGIVETVEDFGTQGMPPSHPGLLDWLALQFVNEHRWRIKSLLKQMVMSATYRQAAIVRPEHLAIDPGNRLYARAPRIRLSAEQIRDQALAVSGLLSHKMFGPSVMPPQPDGIWQVIYSNEKWTTSEGEDGYRRALYTYWRRTSPYPAMTAFDSPSREFCTTRRIRTNTPLQALVTLNDPVYLETARALARCMFATAEQDPVSQVKTGYMSAVCKEPSEEKIALLMELYDEAMQHFSEVPEAAQKLTAADDGAVQELAGLTVVANAIMNLDEFITKE